MALQGVHTFSSIKKWRQNGPKKGENVHRLFSVLFRFLFFRVHSILHGGPSLFGFT
jgi:hypothetical protein